MKIEFLKISKALENVTPNSEILKGVYHRKDGAIIILELGNDEHALVITREKDLKKEFNIETAVKIALQQTYNF